MEDEQWKKPSSNLEKFNAIYWLHKWISNNQIDNANHIVVVMPMYNLIEYSDDYSKAWGGLW